MKRKKNEQIFEILFVGFKYSQIERDIFGVLSVYCFFFLVFFNLSKPNINAQLKKLFKFHPTFFSFFFKLKYFFLISLSKNINNFQGTYFDIIN